MDHRPQAKSLLAFVTFAQELLYLNRAGSMLRTTNQWQDPKILIFFAIRINYEKLGHMLKPTLSKLSPDLSARLKYIAEKQVPAELKPIVGVTRIVCRRCHFLDIPQCKYC